MPHCNHVMSRFLMPILAYCKYCTYCTNQLIEVRTRCYTHNTMPNFTLIKYLMNRIEFINCLINCQHLNNADLLCYNICMHGDPSIT